MKVWGWMNLWREPFKRVIIVCEGMTRQDHARPLQLLSFLLLIHLLAPEMDVTTTAMLPAICSAVAGNPRFLHNEHLHGLPSLLSCTEGDEDIGSNNG